MDPAECLLAGVDGKLLISSGAGEMVFLHIHDIGVLFESLPVEPV